jgi:hypothetical protein
VALSHPEWLASRIVTTVYTPKAAAASPKTVHLSAYSPRVVNKIRNFQDE